MLCPCLLADIRWETVYASGPKDYIDYSTVLITRRDSA